MQVGLARGDRPRARRPPHGLRRGDGARRGLARGRDADAAGAPGELPLRPAADLRGGVPLRARSFGARRGVERGPPAGRGAFGRGARARARGRVAHPAAVDGARAGGEGRSGGEAGRGRDGREPRDLPARGRERGAVRERAARGGADVRARRAAGGGRRGGARRRGVVRRGPRAGAPGGRRGGGPPRRARRDGGAVRRALCVRRRRRGSARLDGGRPGRRPAAGRRRRGAVPAPDRPDDLDPGGRAHGQRRGAGGQLRRLDVDQRRHRDRRRPRPRGRGQLRRRRGVRVRRERQRVGAAGRAHAERRGGRRSFRLFRRLGVAERRHRDHRRDRHRGPRRGLRVRGERHHLDPAGQARTRRRAGGRGLRPLGGGERRHRDRRRPGQRALHLPRRGLRVRAERHHLDPGSRAHAERRGGRRLRLVGVGGRRHRDRRRPERPPRPRLRVRAERRDLDPGGRARRERRAARSPVRLLGGGGWRHRDRRRAQPLADHDPLPGRGARVRAKRRHLGRAGRAPGL